MRLETTVRLRPAVPVFTGTLTVILLLVFFLLLSSSFLLQPGVALTLPGSRFLLSPMQAPLVVAVTGGPAAAVYFEDREVDLAQLQSRLEARSSVSRQLVIKADRNAPLAMVGAVTEIAMERGFEVALAAVRRPEP